MTSIALQFVLHHFRIGLAKEKDGLYYLEASKESRGDQPMSLLSTSNKDTLWLCHYWHPSFNVLKIMFPHLYENSDTSKFH